MRRRLRGAQVSLGANRAVPIVLALALGLLVGLAALRPVPEVPVPHHPGDEAALLLSAERRVQLDQRTALRAAQGIPPRTRHLEPDGSPTYTNRLIETSSPYLHQHAHNPVAWFPWSDEAFELAASLDRPVLLSIGYATCHWCHVMEEESFEDPEIAAWINAHFIPVKVDRETRPDLDAVYMAAVTASMGRGGWPATLVLRPDKQPFFAATYLPARNGDRGRTRGLLSVLKQIAGDWEGDRSRIDRIAEQLTAAVRQDLRGPAGEGVPGPEALDQLRTWAEASYDPVYGGTKRVPKFPSSFPLRVLLADDAQASLEMARTTLDRMAAGGMYDQVGGGFHRYSTDGRWGIPHFEKMLYDNALLARTYGEAFQRTGDLRYARIVDETLQFVLRDLGADTGGFYSALDADSVRPDGEVEEGWYYSWTPEELRDVLGDRAAAFQQAYGVTPAGNFEGRTVLHFPEPVDLATRDGFRKDRLQLELVRRQRPAPLLDDKVLTSWNGLTIGALAYNGWLLGREEWVDAARDAADRLLEARTDGRLARVANDEGGEGTAFLDDYAFLAEGLITLFEATGEIRWLDEAVALVAVAEAQHGSDGAWYATPADHEALLAREQPLHDGAIPSANSVLVGVLLRLAALTGDDLHRQRAEAIAGGLALKTQPIGFPNALLAFQGAPLREIVLVANPGERSSGLHAALKILPPNQRVLVRQTAGEPAVVRLAEGKLRLDAPTAYVCRGGVCDRPTTDPAELAAMLAP